MSNELTDVRCPCGAEFQADSYDAGFIAGSGMCQNCDAALPPKDICTCPSGDGSLRHPCPAHPAAEQAGGDERAGLRAAAKWHREQRNAFEAEAEMHRQRYENTNRPDSLTAEAEHHRRLWETASAMAANHLDYAAGFEEMARAALAQPSPAQAEKAEAERPEVVGYLATAEHPKHGQPHKAFNYFKDQHDAQVAHWRERSCEVSDDELMTVAQHERIVGALRFERQQMDRAFTACINERDAADARLHEVATACATAEQERDAALARVAELELKLDQSDYAYDNDRHHMRGMAKQAAEAIQVFTGHDSGANLAHRYGEKWWEHLDELRDALLAFAKNAPPAQAQHSVPGKYDDVLLPFLKSMEHELHANAGKGDRPGWLQMDRRTALLEIYYHLAKLQKATKDNDAAGIVEYAADVANMSMMLVDVCGLLAAAPGKEGL